MLDECIPPLEGKGVLAEGMSGGERVPGVPLSERVLAGELTQRDEEMPATGEGRKG